MDWVAFFLVAQVALIAYAVGRIGGYGDGYEAGYTEGWNSVAVLWKQYEAARRAYLEAEWERLYKTALVEVEHD